MKLQWMILKVHEWRKDWEPHEGLSKYSRGFYKSFYEYLTKKIRELELELDTIKYEDVD